MGKLTDARGEVFASMLRRAKRPFDSVAKPALAGLIERGRGSGGMAQGEIPH